MATFEIAAYGALWGMVALMVTIAILVILRSLLPGTQRNRLDEDRVLLAYRDAWDLTAIDVSKTSRLGEGRAHRALDRLKGWGLIESYTQGGRVGYPQTIRYTLTNLGREAVLDLERAKIAEADNDRHGA